jgi:hypothetical protein
MIARSPTQPIRSRKQSRPKMALAVLSALLATQVLIADARADSPSNLMLADNPHRPSYSRSSAQARNVKSYATSTDQQTRGCWERRRRGGRWKRTNVCFLEGKNVGP